MEVRPHGHSHEDQTPTSEQEEEDHHHHHHHHHSHPPEKIKSVLKKVKDKAKKIKNTLKKHGHDDHDSSNEEEEEEDHVGIQMEEKQSSEDGEIKVNPKLKRESVVKDDPFMTFEQEPNSPKPSLFHSDYQSKPTDSTDQMGITSSFNKMNINSVDDHLVLKDDQLLLHNQPKSPDLLTDHHPQDNNPPSYLTKKKMSPGEEDKEALSETISINAQDQSRKKEMGEVVTVSEELEKRLGSCEAEGKKLPGVSETMVERIRGTVGSWLGLRSDQSQASIGTTTTTNIIGGGNGNENDNNNVGGKE